MRSRHNQLQKVKTPLLTIEINMVSKNRTHLLQPLDLSTNHSLNKFEKKAFSEYFCSSILKELKDDPTCDVTAITVDLGLSRLKPFQWKFFAGERTSKSYFNGPHHQWQLEEFSKIYII